MPHILVEYSANLRGRIDVHQLLSQLSEAALTTGVFPIGGLRARAYAAEHYYIADAHPDNAFVHVVLKIGHGRDADTRKRACEIIFAALTGALRLHYEAQPLGISLELQEIDPVLTFKQNNLHDYVISRRAEGRPAHA